MKPKRAAFITSATEPSGFPEPRLPEFAFAGRSNVGKSSLINLVVGRPGLAKTSNTPGRTRLINWFEVVPQKGAAVALVDLPGYGFARVPMEIRESWRPMVERYLVGRDPLRAVFVLVDARRGIREEERDLVDWLSSEDIQPVAVVTKSDKLAKNKRKPVAMAIKKDLRLHREPILTSVPGKEGIAELWRCITHLS